LDQKTRLVTVSLPLPLSWAGVQGWRDRGDLSRGHVTD